MKLARKSAWLGAALAGLFLTTGCYGNFNLTQRTWHFNGHMTDNRWVNEAAFFVVGGIVYPITSFADALVLNSWEWWTGKNLVDAPAGDHK